MNNSDQDKSLLNGLGTITEIVARYRATFDIWLSELDKKQGLFDLDTGFRGILLKLYIAILEYQARAACQLNRSTLLRVVRNFPKFDDWTGLRSKITDLDTQCRLYHSVAASHSQLLSTQLLKDSLDRQETHLDDLVRRLDDMQNVTREVILSISDVMVGQDHEDIRGRLGSQYWNSGQWLLKHNTYETWLESPNGLLWLRGPIGVGKTCLTSIVIQQALSSAVKEQIAFFYCSEHKKSESVDIFRAIVAQFSYDTNGNLAIPTRKWFDQATGTRAESGSPSWGARKLNITRKISSTECVDLLTEIAELKGDHFTIVVDGLDECLDGYELLEHLETLQSRSSRFRLFLSSRLSLHDDYKLSSLAVILDFDSAKDIETYVKTEVNSHNRRSRSGMTQQ